MIQFIWHYQSRMIAGTEYFSADVGLVC